MSAATEGRRTGRELACEPAPGTVRACYRIVEPGVIVTPPLRIRAHVNDAIGRDFVSPWADLNG